MNCLPPGQPSSWGSYELHEMKRDNKKPAIVSACKRHGIKVSGENKDALAGQLFDHLKEKWSGCSRKLVIDDTDDEDVTPTMKMILCQTPAIWKSCSMIRYTSSDFEQLTAKLVSMIQVLHLNSWIQKKLQSLSKTKKTMNTSSRRLPMTRRKKQPTISKPGKGSNNIMFSQQQHRRGRYRNRNRQKLKTSLRKKMRTKKTCLLQIQTEQSQQVAQRSPATRTMMNVQRNSLNLLNWKRHTVRDDFKLKRSKQKLRWRWQKPNYSNRKLLHSSWHGLTGPTRDE